MVLGRDGEDLVEEERVLEAPLDGLDEETGEIPRVRAAVTERPALCEVRPQRRFELLQSDDGAVVAGTVGCVDLLDPRELVPIRQSRESTTGRGDLPSQRRPHRYGR
jgi:hypothetical protein